MRVRHSGSLVLWKVRSPVLLMIAYLLCPGSITAAVAYDVKGVALGGGMLDAYLVLQGRYGDRVEVGRGRHADTETETINITASADDCGTVPRRRCEQITVSSVLPLYRQTVVRIEVIQSFFSEPSEQQLVTLFLEKYGSPTLDETHRHRRASSRTMRWANDSATHAMRGLETVNLARNPGRSYVAVYFDVAPDGRVRDLKLVSEDSASLQRNSDLLRRGDARLLEARRRAELAF